MRAKVLDKLEALSDAVRDFLAVLVVATLLLMVAFVACRYPEVLRHRIELEIWEVLLLMLLAFSPPTVRTLVRVVRFLKGFGVFVLESGKLVPEWRKRR
ncbi:MAG TPA: hypothetical protein ENF26_03300 [Methanomicrobia archaeon]|nr:hypothetical protein [Methanomicrobia archaeon]HEX59157.1 hypothetical protein [Methanomicrobia archaeon]